MRNSLAVAMMAILLLPGSALAGGKCQVMTDICQTTSTSVIKVNAAASQATSADSSTFIPTTNSSTPTTVSPSNSTAKPDPKIPFLRGVNLGGWLILESWMDSDLFTGAFASAVDQYTFDSIPGAKAALEQHWETFFTEDDIASLAKTGINALRIPIGFWAYDNKNTPYIQGADKYLELAIGWARKYGLKVWVDCHGSPGSQNGFDSSGHGGVNNWQRYGNLNRSISVLKTMGAKYGAKKYADVVVGLELANEPRTGGNNVFNVTQLWAQDAYKAVKAEVANENLVIVMHDAFEGPLSWLNIGLDLIDGGPKTFGIDTHLYQIFKPVDNTYTQKQHIAEACGWAANLSTANFVMPTYVGEWTTTTNICVNPGGSTTAGTSCSVKGCQCQSEDFANWNDTMIEQVRKYVEAQMDVFEKHSSGYFMWAAKGPDAWGFLNGIEKGLIPNPVTSRKYPNQCKLSLKRREVRGRLGVGGEAF